MVGRNQTRKFCPLCQRTLELFNLGDQSLFYEGAHYLNQFPLIIHQFVINLYKFNCYDWHLIYFIFFLPSSGEFKSYHYILTNFKRGSYGTRTIHLTWQMGSNIRHIFLLKSLPEKRAYNCYVQKFSIHLWRLSRRINPLTQLRRQRQILQKCCEV